MTKRCVDCGIIFQTDDPEKERCELCEDDRKDEEEADSDYLRNCYRIFRYKRRYENTKPGIIKILYFTLLRLMIWVNEHLIRGCE